MMLRETIGREAEEREAWVFIINRLHTVLGILQGQVQKEARLVLFSSFPKAGPQVQVGPRVQLGHGEDGAGSGSRTPPLWRCLGAVERRTVR